MTNPDALLTRDNDIILYLQVAEITLHTNFFNCFELKYELRLLAFVLISTQNLFFHTRFPLYVIHFSRFMNE